MLPLIILADGGHAKVLIDLAQSLGREILGFTVPREEASPKPILGVGRLGTDAKVLSFSTEAVELVNGLGSASSTEARRGLYLQFAKKGYRFATLVHPSAVVSRSVELGMGVQVMAGAVIQCACRIGENCIINTRSSLDHDCVLGAHCHVAPGATLSGGVNLGTGTHIGTGASLIEGITLGRDCLVAAGAVVVRDFGDQCRLRGVPAQLF